MSFWKKTAAVMMILGAASFGISFLAVKRPDPQPEPPALTETEAVPKPVPVPAGKLLREKEPEKEQMLYYLKEDYGLVNIYLGDGTTLYENTDIALTDLPRELQEEICGGKGLKTRQEMYDFMENYSS